MPSSAPTMLPIPREAIFGIQGILELGEDRIQKLAALQCREVVTLQLMPIYENLASQLQCEVRVLRAVFQHALIPLNGLRRSLEMPSSDFLNALIHTVREIAEIAREKWKEQHLSSWNTIGPQLAPFFEPDNFFAQVSKAFDLLSERPAVLQSPQILTEIRPIFDEAATKTVAVLQTNTLVLHYLEGDRQRTLHISLDSGDLSVLENELSRARRKIEVSRSEAIKSGISFLTYGEPDRRDAE